MRHTDILDRFPERLRTGTRQPDVICVKQPGCAVHNRPIESPAPGAILVLNDGQIAVYRDEPPPEELARPGVVLTALYADPVSDTPAVPTGLVFLRFQKGIMADARRDEIDRAGYEIAETIPYAPQAAWLRARSGQAADALTNLSQLEQLPGVETVEPQLLREAARRS